MTIDAAALAELKALDESGGGGLLDELIELFKNGTPERIARIREAGGAGDPRGVEREAHALKGSCGALGATLLLSLASELEQRAKAGEISDCASRLEAIEREFVVVLGELKAEQKKP